MCLAVSLMGQLDHEPQVRHPILSYTCIILMVMAQKQEQGNSKTQVLIKPPFVWLLLESL